MHRRLQKVGKNVKKLGRERGHVRRKAFVCGWENKPEDIFWLELEGALQEV